MTYLVDGQNDNHQVRHDVKDRRRYSERSATPLGVAPNRPGILSRHPSLTIPNDSRIHALPRQGLIPGLVDRIAGEHSEHDGGDCIGDGDGHDGSDRGAEPAILEDAQVHHAQ